MEVTLGTYVYMYDGQCSKWTEQLTIVCCHVEFKGHARGRAQVSLGAHAQRGVQYLVCKSVRLSVRLSVTTFSATTRNKAAKKRCQCHTGLILKIAIFVKVLRSKVMA